MRGFLGIPVAVVSGDVAEAVPAASIEAAAVRLHTDVRPTRVDAQNVVARLPGANPLLADEYVIVGAHYDHLGFGGDGSLAPDSRDVHNGADDNASGTPAVIEIGARADRGATTRSQRPVHRVHR